MRFKLDKISVSFGENTILDGVDFEINEKEKIAIIGRNGCGKTTLLKVIMGEQEIDGDGSGESNLNKIQKTGTFSIGHLKQIAFSSENETMEKEILKVFSSVINLKEKIEKLEEKMQCGSASIKEVSCYDELLRQFDFAGGYSYLKEYNLALKKFGFTEEDKSKKIGEFSGGQRTKLALIKLLLSKPDLLVLDEPTNHLDITSIEWLEEFLASYPKAVLVVSHDRAFLDKFVTSVYEIERHKMKRYEGNYSAFLKRKTENYEKDLKEYESLKEERARLQAVADRFRYKATKAKMAQSKLKQIERLGDMDSPLAADSKSFSVSMKPNKSGNEVLLVDEASIGYDNVLTKLSFRLMRGDRVGVVGENGAGKSTLLKTIAALVPPLGGKLKFGTNVEMGYFDQQVAANNISNETVLESYQREFPLESIQESRTALGSFMFSGDDVFKKLSELSGGELVRLELCKIFRKSPNFLVLDEPTNHMDIAGKEALESILENYEGTILFVSHDRYFINKIAKDLIVFEGGGAKVLKGTSYFDYEDQKKKEAMEDCVVVQELKKKGEVDAPKVNMYEQNKEKARRANKKKKLEEKISIIESEIEKLKELFFDDNIASNYERLMEIQSDIDKKQAEADRLTEEWMAIE